MTIKKSLSLQELEKQSLAKLKGMYGMDAYRLRMPDFPDDLPLEYAPLKATIWKFYELDQTKKLIGTILDAVLQAKTDIFLLSRRDCQKLVDNNPKVFKKFTVQTLTYRGMISELGGGGFGYVRFTLPPGGKKSPKPMVVEIIDPYVLSIVGESPLDYRARVFQSIGIQLPRNSDTQLSSHTDAQASSYSDTQLSSYTVIQTTFTENHPVIHPVINHVQGAVEALEESESKDGVGHE